MPAIRFVHCADLHLGARFGRLPLQWARTRRQQQRHAFAEAVELALDPAAPADLFLIVGDTFDSEKPHPTDLAFFLQQLVRLGDGGVRCVIISGNHDRYFAGSWWDRSELPVDAVFTEPGLHQHVMPDLDLTIFALPADPARTTNNLIREIQLDVPTRRSILLLHGTWLNFGRDECEVESHPFSTDDLAALPVDYVALGHYHSTREATPAAGRPVVFYPGSPEAIGFSAGGEEGGVVIGVMEEDGSVRAEVRRVSSGRHRKLSIDCTTHTPGSLERAVADGLQPCDYILVEFTGTPTAETAVAAEELCDKLQGGCAYMSVLTLFNDIGQVPEDNIFYNKFRQAIAQKLAEAPEPDKPKWRRALELGTVAFLSAKGL